jgi:hypothetical protein
MGQYIKFIYEESIVQYSHRVGIPIKLLTLTEMCLNDAYGKVCTDTHLSDIFLVQNGLKQDD